MSSTSLRMACIATFATISSTAWAVNEECLVSVGVAGTKVIGLHGLSIPAGYDVWVFSGQLKKNGVEQDYVEIHSPDDDWVETQATKVNCQNYLARTDGQMDKPGPNNDIFCNLSDSIMPDTRPPMC